MIHHEISYIPPQAGTELPLYEKLATRITELVKRGTLRPGERVPSVRHCSRQQNVSVSTVTQAYRLLEDRGVIEARPQSGYYVRPQRWVLPAEPAMSRPPVRSLRVDVTQLVLEVIKSARDPKLVRFGTTLPHPDLFPNVELNRAAAAAGRRAPVMANAYDVPAGNIGLRTQVARRALDAGCTLAPDDIIVTVGATEALNLCLRAVAKPGDVIGIESPTYFGVLQIIESLGMRVCEIPTDPREGVCLEELERRIKCCDVKACVFGLNYNNPLGSCMPDDRKEELVRLMTRLRVPLIEDDIYGSLSFAPARPKVAKAYDTEGWVMLCDSFTKTLAPGYRVGWVAPGRFKDKVEFLKYINTSCNPPLPQMAVAEFLGNGGYDHHLRKIRRLYAGQMQLMGEAVSRYFPEGTRSTRPNGGVCLWVELPKPVDTLKLYHDALAAGISIAPGALFAAKNKYSNYMRMNCGNPWSTQLEDAMKKLGELAKARVKAER